MRFAFDLLDRWRRRQQQRALARAKKWLEMCQNAAENHHPVMYDDLVSEAEIALAEIKEEATAQRR